MILLSREGYYTAMCQRRRPVAGPVRRWTEGVTE